MNDPELRKFWIQYHCGHRKKGGGVGDGENERKRRRGKENEISWFIFRNNSVDNSMSLRQR